MSFAAAMLVALALDLAVGWPDALYRRIGHPVSWLGRAIAFGEASLHKGEPAARRANISPISRISFTGPSMSACW